MGDAYEWRVYGWGDDEMDVNGDGWEGRVVNGRDMHEMDMYRMDVNGRDVHERNTS